MSENEYDWLGSGVYFWESNPARAFHWAKHLKKVSREGQARIRQPYSIGAVIALGYCLDLISTTAIEFVKRAYSDFKLYMNRSGSQLPTNNGGDDLLQRYLDCAVTITFTPSINGTNGRPLRQFGVSFSKASVSMRHQDSTRRLTSRSACETSPTSKAYSASLFTSLNPCGFARRTAVR
jgi:hypothetical protein